MQHEKVKQDEAQAEYNKYKSKHLR